ncbi:transposase [Geitlerinema sp. CS-897]|nr:transposase [Geitlerinema sp. CS-897]
MALTTGFRIIAQFCQALKPAAWEPSSEEIQSLQTYTRRLQALEGMIAQERNRLHVTSQELQADLEEHIQFLEAQVQSVKKRLLEHIQAHDHLQQQHQRLTTIPGLGKDSAARLLAEIGSVEHFPSARQLAAFAGVTPQERQSGTSVRGKTRLCKIGNPRLRKALYFPALSMIRCCPQIKLFRERLLAAGRTRCRWLGRSCTS